MPKPKRKVVKDTQPTGEWEREFDKEFVGVFYKELTVKGLTSSYNATDELKSFIRNLLLSDREKVIKEIEGFKLNGTIEEHLGEYAGISKSIDGGAGFENMRKIRNSVLSDVLAHLKSNLK